MKRKNLGGGVEWMRKRLVNFFNDRLEFVIWKG